MSAEWTVQDAKAQFSALVRACLENGPQVITKRGKETAVVVSVEEWRRAAGADEPTLKDLLTADDRRTVIEVPARGRLLHRPLTRVA